MKIFNINVLNNKNVELYQKYINNKIKFYKILKIHFFFDQNNEINEKLLIIWNTKNNKWNKFILKKIIITLEYHNKIELQRIVITFSDS